MAESLATLSKEEELLREISRLRLETAQLQSNNSRLQSDSDQQAIQTSPTTLLQLLEKCHESFVDNLHVELDPRKTTTGTTTSVTKKLRPKTLKPWIGFPELRKDIFDRIEVFLQLQNEEDQRCFLSPHKIEGIAEAARRRVSCEQDLRNYHQPCVEFFVSSTIDRLIGIPEARSKLHLGEAMTLENHTHCITANAGENGAESTDYRPKDTDQLCVKHHHGERLPVAIFEMKPPHKATAELLTAGLHRFDDIGSEVINQTTKPPNNQDKFQQAADKFVAMIITQTYSYMAKAGIGHGCIITGQAMVFLLLKEEEPYTVYFYHADPKAEVDDELEIRGSFPYECTAIAQLSSFCLMAHGVKESSQQWRKTVDNDGPRWEFKDREPEHDIPLKVMKYERPQSALKRRREITLSYQSPLVQRSNPPVPPKPSKPAKAGCKPTSSSIKQEPSSDNDSGSDFDPHDTPTRNRPRHQDQSRQSQGKHQRDKQSPPTSRGTAHKYAYCSHGCLKGLVDRTALDTSCPNFALHPQHHASDRHALTRPLLARLLRQQLAVDLDNYCINLRKGGRTGMLFKLTLLSHGYTFVAKGTGRGFIRSAKLEGRVYSLLKERQGQSIPVYLGNINLIQKWIGGNFDVVHMLLMSWAGESVALNIARDEPGQLLVQQQVEEFERQCILMGIHHRDTFHRNILWGEETKQIMFIDFDQTILFNLRRPPPDTVDSMLYVDVFGSPTRRAALEYMIMQEETKLAEQSMQTTAVSTKAPRSAHPVEPDAISHPKEKVEASGIGITIIPSWLSVDKQKAIVETDAEGASAYTIDTDIPQHPGLTDDTATSPSKAKLSGIAVTKQTKDTTTGETDNNWRIYTEDDDKENEGPSRPIVDSSCAKPLQRALKKSGKQSFDEEDKENNPVVDPMWGFVC
ncbi:MAG: hypothetical protein LQ343_006693 [Gyalolechia ehrenbergii]|nr:MAG: hypothetical protein LQ343_006693 [Gyalolechia ehrenbergii]